MITDKEYFTTNYPQFIRELAINAIVSWGLSARVPASDMITETVADVVNKFIEDLANADFKTRRAVIKRWL